MDSDAFVPELEVESSRCHTATECIRDPGDDHGRDWNKQRNNISDPFHCPAKARVARRDWAFPPIRLAYSLPMA